jgi:hypothetical protein
LARKERTPGKVRKEDGVEKNPGGRVELDGIEV